MLLCSAHCSTSPVLHTVPVWNLDGSSSAVTLLAQTWACALLLSSMVHCCPPQSKRLLSCLQLPLGPGTSHPPINKQQICKTTHQEKPCSPFPFVVATWLHFTHTPFVAYNQGLPHLSWQTMKFFGLFKTSWLRTATKM